MLTELFNNPFSFFIWIIALLVALTIHEFSHALVADYLGDPTAKLQGRLTLNPFAHLDLFGTLFLLIARIGWGKPVPVDEFNLQHPRRDAALISLAGPTSNLILAIILSLILRFLPSLVIGNWSLAIGPWLLVIFIPMIILNVSLAIFNLLPLHPLDGFKIVAGILPRDLADQWNQLESYGLIFLFLFLATGWISNFIQPVISVILNLLLPGLT